MGNKIFELLEGKYWVLTGLITYFLIATSSIVRSIEPIGFLPNAYMAIDWFAACIYYFFVGAILGLFIDWYFAKKNRKKIGVPMWLVLTCSLWVISSVTAAIINNPDVSKVLVIIFPLAFSIFFTGYAFTLLFPDSIVKSYLGKLFFDIALLAVFVSYIYFSFKLKENARLVRILLIIIFFIFFLGFVGCAINLSS